jgi:capsular polysaccharide biosynthesis protein
VTAASDHDWSVPAFPEEPRGEVTLQTVDSAYLTPVQRGPLRVLYRPVTWMRGAVHDAKGRLVVESQKIGGLGGAQIAQADPGRVRPSPEAPRLEGTWLYGGHWMRHFGHFITETVTTLWPNELAVDGLVFHSYFSDEPTVKSYQQDLIDLTGFPDLPIRIVQRRPLSIERLLVPSRSVVLNGWAHPEASDVWDRITGGVGPLASTRRVFFSRARFNAASPERRRPARTTPAWDSYLDMAFADAGFEVLHPETLGIAEQLRIAGGAQLLAGSAGSALHLAAFGPRGRAVLEIGDPRSPEIPVPMQQVVNCAREHRACYVPFDDAAALESVLAGHGPG